MTHIEHERKYLVDPERFTTYLEGLSPDQYVRKTVQQWYITDTVSGFTGRLRYVYVPSTTLRQPPTYFLTFKKPTDDMAKRVELESTISKEMFEGMLQHFDLQSFVSKTRIYFTSSQHPVEEIVDIFPNGLMLYEIENPPKNFVPPSWCTDDVTNDKAYISQNLGCPSRQFE